MTPLLKEWPSCNVVLALFPLLTVVGSILSQTAQCSKGPCGPGQYKDSTANKCITCPDGFYMNLIGHGCLNCTPCTQPRHKQIITRQCNPSEDAEITCIPGYFMNGVAVSFAQHCRRCTKCRDDEKEISPCDGRKDRHCSLSTTAILFTYNQEASKTSELKHVTISDIFRHSLTYTSTKNTINQSIVFESLTNLVSDNNHMNLIIVLAVTAAFFFISLVAFIYIYFHFNKQRRQLVPTNDNMLQ